MSSFIHLHLHTQFSLLDGVCRINELVWRAKELGMSAVAMTDHGNLFGVIDFYEAAKEAGVKPVIGCEVYVAPRSCREQSGDQKETSHLVLLAETNEGYSNLIKLVSAGYLEGFYYKPRIDKDLLRKYSRGLIALSACLKGEVPKRLVAKKYEEALQAALEYRAIFGSENFFLEIMDHGIPEQKLVNEGLLSISQQTGIPLVATNDVHYLRADQAQAHEALVCIQRQTTLSDPQRPRMGSNQFYFKSSEEMAVVFSWIPQALENTLTIAKRCNVTMEFDKFHVPEYPTPAGESTANYLRKLCLDAVPGRYGQMTPAVSERLEFELKTIADLGFIGYFLIVWDFVNFAQKQGVPVGPGRGSAAGSIVSYLLGITDLDPIKYSLLFERFLNPSRKTMPDIDIDFCFERRAEVIDYVTKRFGRENVAQIITFGTMQAKAVVRDVARVMGLPYADADRIAKMIPNELGITLEEAIAAEPQLRQIIGEDETTARLIETAKVLEGLNRHASIHAAGVVISDKPLIEYVPLYRSPDDQITTAFTMKGIEKIGLLKMDFLGLKTLTLIEDALNIIEARHGRRINIRKIPLDDAKAYELLSRGESAGVFQLESDGMKSLLKRVRPSDIEDLISILALYRPGPMQSGMMDDFVKRKRGEEEVRYPHPKLEPILKNSYGVAIYQEQVMQMSSVLAGFSMAEADNLRRAMSKKKADVMQKMRMSFVQGCKIHNNILEDQANHLFDLIDFFSGYGFNRSHSAAYAIVSYQTAYLKANYPVEFMCALLTNEKDNTDKIVEYIKEAQAMGLKVLPPDVNESVRTFSVVDQGSIRYGLLGVKNIGGAAIESLIAERKARGPFRSLFDLCQRVDTRTNNHKALESLIKCGAMDSMGARRSQMLSVLDTALAEGGRIQREKSIGQMSFFEMGEDSGGFSGKEVVYPDIKELPQQQLLAFEKELIGFYLSGHPLDRYQVEVRVFTNATSRTIRRISEGGNVVMIGLIAQVRQTTTKKTGERMAMLQLEDVDGQVEALVFPRAFQKVGPQVREGAIVIVKGKVTQKEDIPKIFIDELNDINELYRLIKSITIQAGGMDPQRLAMIRNRLERFPGEVPVQLQIDARNHRSVEIKVGRGLYVSPSQVLLDEIKSIVGEDSFKVLI